MEKEFEDYWKLHSKQLIAKAPPQLAAELKHSQGMNTAGDWLVLLFVIAPGVTFASAGVIPNEILNFVCALGIIVVLNVVGELLKPYVTGKRRAGDIIQDIKNYYYYRYKQEGSLAGLL